MPWNAGEELSRQTYADGAVFVLRELVQGVPVRVVVRSYGGGEAWVRYVAMPRPVARRVFRLVIDRWAQPVTPDAGYSPTGRNCWDVLRVIRTRRFVVLAQSGCRDV